jgi:hypothetical protein
MESKEVRDLTALDVLDLHVLPRRELVGFRVGRPHPSLGARLAKRFEDWSRGLDGHRFPRLHP